MHLLKKIRAFYRRCCVRSTSFSIVSNNCWGGFVYQYFGLSYNTPFIGLFIFSPDYIKILSDLKGYMEKDLKFIGFSESKYKDIITSSTKYPVGLLGDVEIHFLHYDSNEEAYDKWERRKSRLNYNNLIIKYSERDLSTKDILNQFLSLPYKNKVALTTYSSLINDFCIPLRNEFDVEIKKEWENFILTESPVNVINKFYR